MYHCRNKSVWTLSLSFIVPILILTGFQSVAANQSDNFQVTDYYIHHTSTDPFYTRHNLDPNVSLHVREVVLAGRERTVAKDGKVIVLVHGGTFPGTVAFDIDYENTSLMRQLARTGWDTFALDLEGYGSSSRPPSMDNPEAFPDDPAPVRADVSVGDVARVVDFVRDLRGVDKVHMLGHSAGATIEVPLYAIQHPEKIAKLVLMGANYKGWSRTDEEIKKRVTKFNRQKVRLGYPTSVERWGSLGTKEEFIVPGVFPVYSQAHLASDPKSGELGGAIRAPWGRFVDMTLQEPHFNAAEITAPTLVIRGEFDSFATQEDNQELIEALGSEVKHLVEIANAGHFLHFEKTNVQFYKALQEFLEAEL